MQKCDNAVVVAIADIDINRAKQAAEKFKIPAFLLGGGKIEKADIDAVDIYLEQRPRSVAIAAPTPDFTFCAKTHDHVEKAYEIKEAVKRPGLNLCWRSGTVPACQYVCQRALRKRKAW